MADKSERAAAAVAALFAKKPGATLEEFLQAAVAADKGLSGIARRSFNAIYLLPLKRKAKQAAGGNGRPAGRKKAKATRAAATGRRKKAPTRKKVSRKKATRKKATRGVRLSDSARVAARRLVLERDQQVIASLGRNGDPRSAYDLAADVDEYIERLARALRG